MTQQRLIAVFAGPRLDGGFYESGFRGAEAACAANGVLLECVESVGIEADMLAAAAEMHAAKAPAMMLVHGGRSDVAVRQVAPHFPRTQFLSTHGTQAGPNFSSFNIEQPQSAFLAGALAGLMTQSGVVGHLSGIRIAPGLRSRAAWAQGVAHVRPEVRSEVRIVTCFCGTQDDNAVSQRAALAEIDAGVDIMYTMLNFGRQGAIDACRARCISQIGNVRDWCESHPDVFIASAIADNGRLVQRWIEDVVAGRLVQGEVRTVGMEDERAVRLAMGPRVPDAVRARIDALAAEVRAGAITLVDDYKGAELQAPEA